MTAALRHGVKLRSDGPGRYATLDGRYHITRRVTPGFPPAGRYVTWRIWDVHRGGPVGADQTHHRMGDACAALAQIIKGAP